LKGVELLSLVAISTLVYRSLHDERTYLFIEELKVSSALILDVLGFIILVLPVSTSLPLVLIFVFVVVAEVEIFFLGCFFAV
jgi:hypothetical protein